VRLTKNLRLFEIARVLMRLDHVASIIVNANYNIMWTREDGAKDEEKPRLIRMSAS
jgi:hypothetical protein